MLTNIMLHTNKHKSLRNSVREKLRLVLVLVLVPVLVLGHFCITLSQVLRWQFLMFPPPIYSALACPYLYLPIVVHINMQLTCYCPIAIIILNVRRNLCREARKNKRKCMFS